MFGKIIFYFKQSVFYLLINIRRYINENKLKNINDNNLLKYGFVKFESKKGKELARYLEHIIEDPENCENSSKDKFKILKKSENGIESIAVDANSDFISKYILTEEILEILRNYYGKKFYLRNNPTIEFTYENKKSDAQKFHLDWGLKQVSLMVNLSDTNKQSTHMEYLLGSNKQYKFIEPNRFNQREIKKIEKCVNKFEIGRTTGNIGQISIFDAGCGYHRQVPGKKRIMLHLNFTENFAFTYWNNKWCPENKSYWFSDNSETSNSKSDLLCLVKKNVKKSFFIPSVYNENYTD